MPKRKRGPDDLINDPKWSEVSELAEEYNTTPLLAAAIADNSTDKGPRTPGDLHRGPTDQERFMVADSLIKDSRHKDGAEYLWAGETFNPERCVAKWYANGGESVMDIIGRQCAGTLGVPFSYLKSEYIRNTEEGGQ